MTPENKGMPEWARQEREEDLAWIRENLDVFDFAARWAEPGLAGEGDNPFFMTLRADIASIATLRITAQRARRAKPIIFSTIFCM